MKPADKAKELFDKMYNVKDGLHKYPMCYDTAKQCALIAVDEILKINKLADDHLNYKDYFNIQNGFKSYWQEVKNEIEKL